MLTLYELRKQRSNCLGSRFYNLEIVETEVSAWQDRCNLEGRGIDWKFTRQDADRKLEKYYVS